MFPNFHLSKNLRKKKREKIKKAKKKKIILAS